MIDRPFKLFEHVRDQLGAGSLFIEIGSDRGSGSAAYLNDLALRTGNSFATVDVDPVYIAGNITSYVMSGEQFTETVLPTLQKSVSLVLFDGFDWTYSPPKVRSGTAGADVYNLIEAYAKRGQQLNNLNSAMSHMTQTLNLLPFLADTAVVMFCDTWFSYLTDTIDGKGAGAAYALLANGFQVIGASAKSNYLILGRGVANNVNIPDLDEEALNTVYTGPRKPPNQIIFKNDH